MVCFLTSSPVIPGTLELNPANSFMDELHRRFLRVARPYQDCQQLRRRQGCSALLHQPFARPLIYG